MITAINYEDATIENILPEHRMFMGNTYFYGKIVSMFGKNIMGGKNGPGKILRFMMLKEMLKGDKKGGNEGGGLNGMLPFLLMGRSDNLFDDMFDFDDDEEDDEEVIDIDITDNM